MEKYWEERRIRRRGIFVPRSGEKEDIIDPTPPEEEEAPVSEPKREEDPVGRRRPDKSPPPPRPPNPLNPDDNPEKGFRLPSPVMDMREPKS